MEAKKIYLNGKYLLIDTENLEGYSTFDEANAIMKSQGKRPMTDDEHEALSRCRSVWDNEKKGRTFYVPVDEKQTALIEVFLPAAGYRYASAGSLINVGSNGYYWSSSPSSTAYGCSLYFSSGGVNPSNNSYRAYGFSVRCVTDIKE